MKGENAVFEMLDGTRIHARVRENGKRTWLVCVHGIGEHLERHSYLPEYFGHNFNVFQYDLRGHGKSGGRRAYVEDFTIFFEDLAQVLGELRTNYRMQRYVLFGHSLGGLIACGFLRDYCPEENLPVYLALSSPPVSLGGIGGRLHRALPPRLVSVLGNFPLSIKLNGTIDLCGLSHDPRVAEQYVTDPLTHKRLETRLLVQTSWAVNEVFGRGPLNINVPGHCTMGSKDQIVDPEAAEKFFAKEDTIEFKLFPDAFHEIHNEIAKFKKSYLSYLEENLLAHS